MRARRILVTVLAASVAASLAGSALAKKPDEAGKGPKGKNIVFLGLVTSVTDDGVAETPDSMTFSMLKGNKHARDYVEANPGDVAAAVTGDTSLRFAGSDLTLADYRAGDGVKVKARDTAEGLVAGKVRMVAHRYHGMIETYDAATGLGTMLVAKTDRVGTAYLAGLGNPASVPFVVTPTSSVNREGGGDPAAGDELEMRGRPTLDGTGVEVLRLNAAPAGA